MNIAYVNPGSTDDDINLNLAFPHYKQKMSQKAKVTNYKTKFVPVPKMDTPLKMLLLKLKKKDYQLGTIQNAKHARQMGRFFDHPI